MYKYIIFSLSLQFFFLFQIEFKLVNCIFLHNVTCDKKKINVFFLLSVAELGYLFILLVLHIIDYYMKYFLGSHIHICICDFFYKMKS